jgi:polar amino acid transport system substrate-binding protein
MIEIAQEIMLKHGHKINYEIMNWSRAIAEVKLGKYDAIAGANRSVLEGFTIPRVSSGANENYIWTLNDSLWTYENESSLQEINLGVVNAYSYGEEIDKPIAKKGKNIIKVAGSNPLPRLIQMTESHRIMAFVENPFVLSYTLKNLKKAPTFFKSVSKNISNDPDLFIAFSPMNKNSLLYTKLMDEGISELRKNGRLKVILKKYGLTDWKK